MSCICDIQSVLYLLKQYVPVSDPDSSADNVVIYIQDVSAHIDYYILDWNPDFMEFFALVDPVQYDNVLDLESVPLDYLEDSTLIITVYSEKAPVHWKKIYNQLLPFKRGIPSINCRS